jgi:hypothetical protein
VCQLNGVGSVLCPHISDNAEPTREAIERRFHVPAIRVTGSEDGLGEFGAMVLSADEFLSHLWEQIFGFLDHRLSASVL